MYKQYQKLTDEWRLLCYNVADSYDHGLGCIVLLFLDSFIATALTVQSASLIMGKIVAAGFVACGSHRQKEPFREDTSWSNGI